MTFTMTVGNQRPVIGTPVKADGTPSTATLSNASYQSLDPTVFTVVADPNTQNGAIITSVAAGSATMTETATATEPDGTTTEVITGSVTIIVTAVPPPPPAPAAALTFTFGPPTLVAS